MAHQVFVSITKDIVPFGTVVAKIEPRFFKYFDEIAQTVNLVFSFPQFLIIVEIGNGNYAGQVVGFGKFSNDLVDLVADIGWPFSFAISAKLPPTGMSTSFPPLSDTYFINNKTST